ncbi:MAG: hypothetical protein AAFU73_04905 [Planctomycetota bacterium]
MNGRIVRRWTLVLATLSALTACSSGGSSGTTQGDPPGTTTPFENPGGPTLDPVARVTGLEAVSIIGTALVPGDRIRVEGGVELASELSGPGGEFEVSVPLHLNMRNHLYVIEELADGADSAPVALTITQDREAPTVTMDFPVDGETLSSSSIPVSGRILDRLSGSAGLTVTVNGVAASVVNGPGGTATFSLASLAVEPGSRTVSVSAQDAAGNLTTRDTLITVVPAEGDRLLRVGGQGQTGTVGMGLPAPLRVQALDEAGDPIVGKVCTWRVTRSDGSLGSSDDETEGLHYQSLTNSSGIASAAWRLGHDAGSATQRVEVVSEDLDGRVVFTADAEPGAPAQLNVSSGSEQVASAGSLAMEPLRAWVSDGFNGSAGVDVTFSVVVGGGTLVVAGEDAGQEVTVPTDSSGYASVLLLLGDRPGRNVVDARVDVDTAHTASFEVNGLRPAPDTRFSGLVLDGASRPVVGATCTLTNADGEDSVQVTDIQGLYRFEGLGLAGIHEFHVDGSTATSLGDTTLDPATMRLPELHYETFLAANAENRLARPVQLPILDTQNDVVWDGESEITLFIAGVDGMEMTIQPGSMTLPDGSQPSPGNPVTLALNQVHADDIPMRPDDGASSRLAWTLQPGGAHFDPAIEVCYPNVNGLAPGSTSFLLSFDHGTSRFEVVGSARVDDDGSCARSDLGSGLTVSGWGGQCPPYANTGTIVKDPLEKAKNDLRDHWLETRNTPLGLLNEQIACLAARTCGLDGLDDESPNPTPPDWGQGWVPSVIQCLAADIENEAFLWSSTNDVVLEMCESLSSNEVIAVLTLLGIADLDDFCSAIGGAQHFAVGLVPCFYEHCEAIQEDQDRPRPPGEKTDHELFFEGAVLTCFDDVEGFSALPREIAKAIVPGGAAATRDFVLRLCSLKTFWRDLFESSRGLRGPLDPLAGDDYPPLPNPWTAAEWHVPEFDAIATMELDSPTRDLTVGSSVQLQVLKMVPGRGTVDVAADPETQWLLIDAGMEAEVDANGLLTVSFCSSAFVSMSRPLYVLAVNGDDVAVGQFSVIGVDSDGDNISDHFEDWSGLDSTVYNAPSSDVDGDGLADFLECLYLTSPILSDTDGDGVDDAMEVFLGSDPLNADVTEGDLGSGAEVAVGGQTTRSSLNGGFRINNAPSDGSLLRASSQTNRGGVTLYSRTDAFSLETAEVANINRMVPSVTPPATVLSIAASASPSLLTSAAPNGAMEVLGTMSDDSVVDAALRSTGTSYVSSNPSIVEVGLNGELVALSSGLAFITAANDGAIGVTPVRVVLNAGLTTVVGFTSLTDGSPVPAVVEVLGQGISTTAGAAGRFELQNVVADPGGITLRASFSEGDVTYTAISASLEPVEDGLTDAGLLELDTASTAGRDFTFCFPANYMGATSLELFIAAEAATAGMITAPGIGFSLPFSVQPGVATSVTLPTELEVTAADGVQALAVSIEADDDICVYGMTRIPFSTDAFAIFPTNTFGTEFFAVGAQGLGAIRNGTQLAVVAAEDDTLVTITPSEDLGSRPAGVPFDVTVNAGEAYQLTSSLGDISGTRVTANKPVGVLAGNRCGQVPVGTSFCDTVLEMLPPVSTWGAATPVVSLASRVGGDTVKVIASEADTLVSVEGPMPSSSTLASGEVLELVLDGNHWITADKPIMVLQFAHGGNFDQRPGDPFSMILPPASQYQSSYVFTTPSTGFASHFVNVVAPSSVAATGGVQIDGSTLAASEFEPIGSSGLSGARIPISDGSHTLTGTAPVGITVYGFNNDDSYGYTGGMALDVAQ